MKSFKINTRFNAIDAFSFLSEHNIFVHFTACYYCVVVASCVMSVCPLVNDFSLICVCRELAPFLSVRLSLFILPISVLSFSFTDYFSWRNKRRLCNNRVGLSLASRDACLPNGLLCSACGIFSFYFKMIFETHYLSIYWANFYYAFTKR